MKRIGVLTSGGDAPGMNACLRAVVRMALYNDLEIMGIKRGYAGLIEGKLFPMTMRSVSNIIQRGGTILETARSQEFTTPEGRKMAALKLGEANVEGLIVIGGDGSFRGAHDLSVEWYTPVIGVPATIDNDIYGSDYTIGYDTAVNTALESIDRIRDTAAAHERIFLVEVMGREAGFIALEVGIGGGAEEIIIPEIKTDLPAICKRLTEGKEKGKTSAIVVIAEGDEAGGAFQIAEKIKASIGVDFRVVVLGHIQRGGRPTARDRVLASRLGAAAVKTLTKGEKDRMVGVVNGRLVLTPLTDSWEKKKELDRGLHDLASILAK